MRHNIRTNAHAPSPEILNLQLCAVKDRAREHIRDTLSDIGEVDLECDSGDGGGIFIFISEAEILEKGYGGGTEDVAVAV